MPDALEQLPYHQAFGQRLAGPTVMHRALADRVVNASDPLAALATGNPAALIVGASFGFEAAHVEALVEVAEYLTASTDAVVTRVLDRLIVVLIPLINPDGRAAAMRDWEREPLSDGHHGSGNAYGFLLNRDFFNLSQPETRAVRMAINRYHPVVAYDPHEDMYYLGKALPQVCWTPPLARPYHPDIDSRIIDNIARIGSAIAGVWGRQSFDYLYHPAGEHKFLTLFRLGGRFHLLLCLQGVTALITESARMPGAQTWQDRIRQKVTAAIAFLDEVATHLEVYVGTRYAVRSDLGSPDAFILPVDRNSRGALRAVVEPLLAHGVCVYWSPRPDPAFVIPTDQPDGRLVRALLTVAPWNHIALPPMAGAACLRLSALPPNLQQLWRHAPLDQVVETPTLLSHPAVSPPVGELAAVPNDAEGIAAANRLLDRDETVYRVHDGRLAFRATPGDLVSCIVDGLPVTVSPAEDENVVQIIRRPRIALYAGQGVDQRHHLLEGGIRYGLERMGFPFVRIKAADLRNGVLQNVDLLVVPGGSATEIVHGWPDPGPRWRRPAVPDGIGQSGLEAILRFVDHGGRYLGIGSGGGVLGTKGYLGLVDAQLVDELLGETRVRYRVTQDHPLMLGLTPWIDDQGELVPAMFPAPYYSEPYAEIHGGPILAPGPKATVLAEYTGVDDPGAVRHPDYLEASAHTPAVLYQRSGKGLAIILAVEPGLRGVWRSTLPLLANAVFFAAADLK